MNEKNIRHLESFLLRAKGNSESTACRVADIMGVLIGIKPTTIGDFLPDELSAVVLPRFEKYLYALGLEVTFCDV